MAQGNKSINMLHNVPCIYANAQWAENQMEWDGGGVYLVLILFIRIIAQHKATYADCRRDCLH